MRCSGSLFSQVRGRICARLRSLLMALDALWGHCGYQSSRAWFLKFPVLRPFRVNFLTTQTEESLHVRPMLLE